MTLAFDVLVGAFILVSLIMVVSVPVAYASPSDEGGNTGLWVGSVTWIVLLIAVSLVSALVV